MEYSQHSDQELIELYKDTNDLQVIGELYKRSQHIVLGVCMKYLKDLPAAEDAMMDIFEELIVALRKAEVRNFRPWLGTVARNFLHRKYRKESKVRTLSIDDNLNEDENSFMEFSDDGTLYSDFEETELQEERLRQAIEHLKPAQKECVNLFYIQDYSYAETCKRTGYSFKEVKSYIQNGKRNLKNILEGQTRKDI